MIHHGDCLDVMATLEAESVDAIVTDPPYGLGFMSRHWDKTVPAVDFWREMLRVAKPGAYLLSFAGTRTVYRMGTAIEDAGWIIRDELVWIYASGFPKGRANLKPAHEPIVMARKPGPLRHLNIDECRITWRDPLDAAAAASGYADSRARGTHVQSVSIGKESRGPENNYDPNALPGRWPSNILLTDPELFDQANPYVVGSGATDVGGFGVRGAGPLDGRTSYALPGQGQTVGYGDSGGYSRFFLIPKADRADREPVLGGLRRPVDARMGLTHGGPGEPGKGSKEGYEYHPKPRANVHPTVKPTDLMRHLVRLVTPVGGTVLDPFLGSGTTAIACELEGFEWVGIEKEAEYVAIAEARLNGTQRGLGLSA